MRFKILMISLLMNYYTFLIEDILFWILENLKFFPKKTGIVPQLYIVEFEVFVFIINGNFWSAGKSCRIPVMLTQITENTLRIS